MCRVTDRDDWFDLWLEDRNSILACMVSNMASDLAAGYDYYGKSISEQRAEIDAYKAETDRKLGSFAFLTEKEVNRYCFYDMKRRGAIA